MYFRSCNLAYACLVICSCGELAKDSSWGKDRMTSDLKKYQWRTEGGGLVMGGTSPSPPDRMTNMVKDRMTSDLRKYQWRTELLWESLVPLPH